jgi:hypothetical protein
VIRATERLNCSNGLHSFASTIAAEPAFDGKSFTVVVHNDAGGSVSTVAAMGADAVMEWSGPNLVSVTREFGNVNMRAFLLADLLFDEMLPDNRPEAKNDET